MAVKAVALTDIQVVVLVPVVFHYRHWPAGAGRSGSGMFGASVLMSEIPGHSKAADDHQLNNLPGIWTLLAVCGCCFSIGFQSICHQRVGRSLAGGKKSGFCRFESADAGDCGAAGHCALWLAQNGKLDMAALQAAHTTYGVLMTLVPEGLRGLVFAALIAAIVIFGLHGEFDFNHFHHGYLS